MFSVAAFCMWAVSYVLISRLDSRTAESVVEFSFLTLMGCVGSYVFGRVWQDIRVTGRDKKDG